MERNVAQTQGKGAQTGKLGKFTGPGVVDKKFFRYYNEITL